MDALTKRKTQAGGETVVMSLNLKNVSGYNHDRMVRYFLRRVILSFSYLGGYGESASKGESQQSY